MSGPFKTTMQIDAAPEDVFDHFVKPDLLVSWMGTYARLEAHEGGLFSVDIHGVLIRGHYATLKRPELIEIAWGEAGNVQMPPGASHLRVEIAAEGAGSILTLIHSGLDNVEAGKHGVGWPHFLDRLALAATGANPGPDPWGVK